MPRYKSSKDPLAYTHGLLACRGLFAGRVPHRACLFAVHGQYGFVIDALWGRGISHSSRSVECLDKDSTCKRVPTRLAGFRPVPVVSKAPDSAFMGAENCPEISRGTPPPLAAPPTVSPRHAVLGRCMSFASLTVAGSDPDPPIPPIPPSRSPARALFPLQRSLPPPVREGGVY